MSVISCPHCGGVLFNVSAGGGSEPARGRGGEGASQGSASPAGVEVEFNAETGEWRVNCPEHSWGFGAVVNLGGGKVVKCKRKSDGGQFCRVSIPLAEARRLAGVGS
jgi:hypothetical protein